jgi:uncharacterized cupredoxin-like copper-binding protein
VRPATQLLRQNWLGYAIAPIVLLAFTGCALHAGHGPAAQVARVTERDFKISAPKHLRSGNVVLKVGNRGPERHELIVVRIGRSPLRFRTDGMTVDEDAVRHQTVGKLEPGGAGSMRQLRLHLAPGRYVIFCNMSGHYLGGMHRTLVVGR